jgi:DNA-binding transcriptional LysR family regulator
MERELGGILFFRDPKAMVLTELGERVLTRVRSMMVEYQALQQHLLENWEPFRANPARLTGQPFPDRH